jgi:hypothetical protein
MSTTVVGVVNRLARATLDCTAMLDCRHASCMIPCRIRTGAAGSGSAIARIVAAPGAAVADRGDPSRGRVALLHPQPPRTVFRYGVDAHERSACSTAVCLARNGRNAALLTGRRNAAHVRNRTAARPRPGPSFRSTGECCMGHRGVSFIPVAGLPLPSSHGLTRAAALPHANVRFSGKNGMRRRSRVIPHT